LHPTPPRRVRNFFGETPFGGRFAHPENFSGVTRTRPRQRASPLESIMFRAPGRRLAIPFVASFHSSPKVAARTDSQPGARKFMFFGMDQVASFQIFCGLFPMNFSGQEKTKQIILQIPNDLSQKDRD